MGRGAGPTGGGGPVYKNISVSQIGSPLRGGTVATASSTMPNAVGVGNTLIVVVGSYDSLITSVVGSVNGAFTLLYTCVSNTDNRLTVWSRTNTIAAAAGTETITATAATPATAYLSGGAMEVVGLGAVDKTNTTLASLSVVNSGPNTVAKSLVLTGVVNNVGGTDNFTLPAGYTLMDLENNGDTSTAHQTSYKITSAIETSSASVTAVQAAATYDSFIMSFSAALV